MVKVQELTDQILPADLECCSKRDVASHVMQLLGSQEQIDDRTICEPRVVQYIFDLAHLFGQPAAVKIHAVNLLEDLIRKGAAIPRITFPVLIALAAKLYLTYRRVPFSELQQIMKLVGWEECSTRNLLLHEQQILVTLDFKVESNTVLQLVESILALMHRVLPLQGVSKLFETAGHMSCLYVLYRLLMPEHLRHSRRFAACALIFASKTVLDHHSDAPKFENPHFLRIISGIMQIAENQILSDSGHLLNIILTNDKIFLRENQLPTRDSCRPRNQPPDRVPCLQQNKLFSRSGGFSLNQSPSRDKRPQQIRSYPRARGGVRKQTSPRERHGVRSELPPYLMGYIRDRSVSKKIQNKPVPGCQPNNPFSRFSDRK